MTRRRLGKALLITVLIVVFALSQVNSLLSWSKQANPASSQLEVNGQIPAVRPQWGPDDRILVVAPHPDDEILAAGGIIYEAVAAGAAVKVMLVTNGDGFQWAVRRWYERVLPKPGNYIHFGYRRQKESLAALRRVGVTQDQVLFLGYPDRGIAELWKSQWNCEEKLYRSPFTKATRSPYTNSRTPDAAYCGQSLRQDVDPQRASPGTVAGSAIAHSSGRSSLATN